MTVVAFLALGANLGEPVRQIQRALHALEERAVRVRRQARWYRSAPVGPPGQPDYVNTAAEIETELKPLELLDAAKAVEGKLGRNFGTERWGPRLIDIDIALYDDREISLPQLTIPHAQLTRRRFVLAPLADLVPELRPPGLPPIRTLLAALDDDPGDLQVFDPLSASPESDTRHTSGS